MDVRPQFDCPPLEPVLCGGDVGFRLRYACCHCEERRNDRYAPTLWTLLIGPISLSLNVCRQTLEA